MTTSIVARGLDQLGALLATVTPEDHARATPCADWTVADLSDHVVNSTAGMATMAAGGTPDWSAAPHHDDPAAAFQEQAGALVEELNSEGSQFPAGMAAAELAVHTYDLATALGRDTGELDTELADTGYEFMSASMKPEMRGDAFGPEQPAPEGANAYQRIAAFAGRSV